MRDPEGWKRYRREMKRRQRERRRDPNRLRPGELAAMTPDERREHGRRARLRAKYRLTHGQYDAMVLAQGGACLICRAVGPLVVDHCHTNGHVRGLLCNSCNSGLGFFRDSPDFLTAAIQYLAHP